MPNWIEGTFRARGEKENIKRFILEGLSAPAIFGKEQKIKKMIDYESDDSIEITFSIDQENEDKTSRSIDSLYILKSKRQFLKETEFYINKHKNGDFYIVAPFKAAWSIDGDNIATIAKEYSLDVRVNGYEKGMEYEYTLEVSRKGQVLCDSYIMYDDYEWQCPMPLLGG